MTEGNLLPMLNPKILLIVIAIIIAVAFFFFKDKISSSSNNSSSNTTQSTDTSKESSTGSTAKDNSGNGNTAADEADKKWIEECPKNTFAVGNSEIGGLITLGKEKHVINNKSVELCCITNLESRQSVDSIDSKKCEDATSNAISLQKENGKFIPTQAIYIQDNKICVVDYDSEGVASEAVCTAQ